MNIAQAFIIHFCLLPLCMFPSSFSIQINGGEILNLRAALLKLRDNVLGVSKFQDHVNNAVKLDSLHLNTHNIVQDVSRALSLKFKERIDAVNRLHKAAMDTYAEQVKSEAWKTCCDIRTETLKFDRKYGSKVNLTSMCNIEAPTATETLNMPDEAFLDAATENLRLHPGMKWQYFGSDTGILTQFPATHSCPTAYDNRFRPWYVQASAPKPKDVVLVIDRSKSMEKFGRIEAARESAITVLETLTPDDRVGVVAFSTDAYALGTKKSQEYTSVSKYQGNSIVETPASACYNHTMANANPANVEHLASVIRMMVPSGETYYGKALKIAFDFLQEAYDRDMRQRRSNERKFVLHLSRLNQTSTTLFDTDDVTDSRDRVILFLSDGVPSDRPFDIFKLIQNRNKLLRNSVVFLCFALGNSSFGKALEDMETQRFRFHDRSMDEMVQCQIDVDCGVPLPTPGRLFHVRDIRNLRSRMGLYYSYLSRYHSERKDRPKDWDARVVWSVPYFDAWGLGMVITAAAPIVITDDLIGVVGVDLAMHELMADVTYFHEAGYLTYAFVVDFIGRVLIHPLLPEPLAINDAPVIADITAFERNAEIRAFIKDSLYYASTKIGPSGEPITVDHVFSDVFSTTKVYPTVHEGVLVHDTRSRYSCAAIQWTDFMLCVVVEADVDSASVLGSQQNPPDFKFLYHRFDLYPPPGQLICRNQDHAIAPNTSAIAFSPSAFVDSGKYSETEETGSMVSKYIRYMTTGSYDRNTSTIFKSRIRNSVLASWKLEQIWSSSSMSMSDKKMLEHVVWRYFGSEDGMFRIFPGVTMPKLYNPVRRPWYEMAHALMLEYFTHHIPEQGNIPLRRKEIVSVSPPYLDANGAGLVITLSAAIVEPETEAAVDHEHERPPHVLGVLGADIHLQYFETLLKEQVLECNNTFTKCIIIDTSGYVIYDEFLMNNDRRAVHLASLSNYHIIHSHPDVAHTLINNKVLVRNKCIDVGSVSFKTTYHVDLKELNKDFAISDFAISYVPGTNIILLSIPVEFKSFEVCTTHTLPTESCKPQVVGIQQGESTRIGFDTRCESSCVDKHGAFEHYSRCKNLYDYSWKIDPPPCAPVKYQKRRSKSSASSVFQKKFVKNLPECHGMPSLSDTYHLLSGHQNKSSTIFWGYILLCCCILVCVWIGLNKTRVRFYFRRVHS